MAHYKIELAADDIDDFYNALRMLLAGGLSVNDKLAQASQQHAAPVPAPTPPNPKPRAARVTKGNGAVGIVDTPEGEPAAVMGASPFSVDVPEPEAPPPPIDYAKMKAEANALLLQVYNWSPAGEELVKQVRAKHQVKKFIDVPDEKVPELMAAAREMYARIQGTPQVSKGI